MTRNIISSQDDDVVSHSTNLRSSTMSRNSVRPSWDRIILKAYEQFENEKFLNMM